MFALMLSIAPLQGRADIQPPDELIKSTVREVLEVINQEKRSTDAGQKRLLEFIDAKVLPHFNFERMTKLAVGRPWRSATPEQRKELVTEFRTLLVRTYSKAFTLYKDISVETKTVTVQANADEVTVKTVINRPGAPPLPVNYEQLPMMEKLYFLRSDLPSITHIDYSARIQTVHSETNPRYHSLISDCKKQTGYGVIVNTSFNVRGEPIVCTPEDAYRCLMRTEMDYLVIGNFIFAKTNQPEWHEKDDWRSEFTLD